MDSIDSGASMMRDGEIRVAPPIPMATYNQHGGPIPSVYHGAHFGHRQQSEPNSNFVPQSGPVRAPLSQRRLLQRQQAQMARQREAQQRWLAEQQHRAYHQHHQSPVVNGSDNMAAVAAAAAYRTAAAAAVAAATASAFLYPTTVFTAMPSQPLILEPTTVITQTAVAGAPFQLVQPQEVAVERVFAPAAAVAAQATLGTVLSRNGGGRTVVFRPQPSNTGPSPSFAPYFLVDNGHYHGYYHHHHHRQQQQQHWQQQQWPPGATAISLRQLVEFMDLPQGATQQVIEKCSCIRVYQFPTIAVPVGEEDKCSVCLSEFEANENIRTLPCSHFFHVECIDRWLVCNKKCPVCRLHIDRDLQHPHSTGGQ